MKHCSLLLSLLMLAGASTALAENRDPYVGEWSGDCGSNVQCWMEIEQRDGTDYELKFIMAERRDANKILCQAPIAMTRRPLKFNATLQYPDSLAGSIDVDEFLFILPGEGSLKFVTEADCKGTRIHGEYYAIGD